MTPVTGPPPSRARRLFILAAGTVATIATGLAGCGRVEPQRVPPPPAVKVVVSRKMTLPIIVNPIGTTRALEDVTIRARVKGFLSEKHFQDGGQVKTGQLLLVIDEAPFKLQVEQAEAQLDVARRRAPESDRIERPSKSPRPSGNWTTPSCSSTRSRNAGRGTCCARKAASQEDYDKADAQRKKSDAQVEADQASLDQAVADYRIDIDSAKADLERAKAAVEDARLNLGYCRDVRPYQRADRRAQGQGRQPGRRRRGHRAGHHPAARPDGARLPPACPVSARRDRLAREGPEGRVDRRRRSTTPASRQDHLHRQRGR